MLCSSASCRIADIIVYNCKSEIICAVWNAPEALHDSMVAKHMYSLLTHHVSDDFYIVADTAFGHPKILRPWRKDQIKSIRKFMTMSCQQIASKIKQHKSAVSVRQAAEWGMRAVQGTWRRLRLPLTSDRFSEAIFWR